MTVYFPEATPAEGAVGVKAIAAVADATAAKLATEVNAATTVDLTCFLRAWNPDLTVNTGTAPPRLCRAAEFPREGRTQYPAIELRYVYDPQGDDMDPDNKAKATLTQGTVTELMIRKGPDADEDAYAVGQKYELWKGRVGKQRRVTSSDDEFAEFEIAQNFYPVAEPIYGVIVA